MTLVTVSTILFLITATAFASSGVVFFTTTIDSLHTSNYSVSTQVFNTRDSPSYIMAGGQYGDWWTPSQYPELFEFSPTLNGQGTYGFSASPVATIGNQGTVWSGGFNGSNWLVTGWGVNQGLDPYFAVFNESENQVNLGNTTEIGTIQSEWSGGDVFSVGWNGTDWLLTGMGSGVLYSGDDISNHMSIGLLSSNGTFTDLSQQIPNNQDMILYANAWNGNYWLIGGGWFGISAGVLYVLSGNTLTDITSEIAAAVPTFNSIQSIVWNGQYFLIGGVGFLAEYNGTTFTDLTPQLNSALDQSHSLANVTDNAVNAIAWMGSYWMLAGGTPVAYQSGVSNQSAWVASFTPASDNSSTTFKDITSTVIPHDILQSSTNSTILSMSCWAWSGCALGGADSNGGVLIWFDGQKSVDLSSQLNQNVTYVQWVGLGNV